MHLAAKENDFEVVNGTINGDSTARAPNWVPILEKHVYAPRKLRLVCIGAGYSGLMLAYHLREMKMEEFIDLRIYEKNHDVGGTWLENRYPGVAWYVDSL
jgi:NADPH-dependent 2,4-dienoyl-CoA reductase/sulfur reductase-like enzyme